MMCRALLAVVGVVVAALLAPTRAADGDLSGLWRLATVTPAGESTVCILKVETKDGKPTASVAFAPEGIEAKVTEFRATEGRVSVTIQSGKSVGKRTTTSEIAFVGVRGTDPKVVLGSTGSATARTRAKLTATDKDTLTNDELVVKTEVPEPMTKAAELGARVAALQRKVQSEKDAEARKDLLKELTDARTEADEKTPDLYRAVIDKHAESPAAFDAALDLLRKAPQLKLTAAEVEKLIRVAQQQGGPYGPVFVGVALAPIAEALAGQLGDASGALAALEPTVKGLSTDDPAGARVTVLSAYQRVLEIAGRRDAAKGVAAEVAKLELVLDAEYAKTVPPFKPAAFAGRKDKTANQVAVMELFTGAQCPPCVAADVAFDALGRAYKSTELVLLQYHLHIPGPDPLTNADTVARQRYYAVTSTPSTFFNGTRAAAGGGGMAAAESKFKQYAGVIDPILEKSTDTKVAGKATRTGDAIDVALEVAGGDGEDMKLRVLVCEETVRYVGGNALRLHHHVVRAMPGGAGGVAINEGTFKHTVRVDLGTVRKGLTTYLDEFARTRPFPKPERPMEMKELKVIALVQNDKTKQIVQAAQLEVESKEPGGNE